ncbi:MAG TPA: DNA alkylation repair protein [Vicinamibacterales bacterium]|nr:DNA alkylation repair protein [Vicinamibacterales bacterium]
MTTQEALATLKKAGKPQTAAIYKRYGTGENVFGTLTSDIAKLKKKIKVDHALALDLWKTGNAEARALALQVADAEKLKPADAARFLKDGVRFTSFYLAELLARSPIAEKTMRAWMKSRDESAREMGYAILGMRLRNDPQAISDVDAARVLTVIEKEIHKSPNWARYAMNGALIAIGVYKPALRKKAVEAAKRIGKVHVDHGETHCKTPDAAPYIEKASKPKLGV